MAGAFLSTLLSYLLVFVVFVAVIALAIFIGITARKIVNKKKSQAVAENEKVKEV